MAANVPVAGLGVSLAAIVVILGGLIALGRWADNEFRDLSTAGVYMDVFIVDKGQREIFDRGRVVSHQPWIAVDLSELGGSEAHQFDVNLDTWKRASTGDRTTWYYRSDDPEIGVAELQRDYFGDWRRSERNLWLVFGAALLIWTVTAGVLVLRARP